MSLLSIQYHESIYHKCIPLSSDVIRTKTCATWLDINFIISILILFVLVAAETSTFHLHPVVYVFPAWLPAYYTVKPMPSEPSFPSYVAALLLSVFFLCSFLAFRFFFSSSACCFHSSFSSDGLITSHYSCICSFKSIVRTDFQSIYQFSQRGTLWGDFLLEALLAQPRYFIHCYSLFVQ